MRKAFADLRALGLGSLVVLACSQQSGLRSSPDAGKVDAGAPGPEGGASGGEDGGVRSAGGAGASTAADGGSSGGVTGSGGGQSETGGIQIGGGDSGECGPLDCRTPLDSSIGFQVDSDSCADDAPPTSDDGGTEARALDAQGIDAGSSYDAGNVAEVVCSGMSCVCTQTTCPAGTFVFGTSHAGCPICMPLPPPPPFSN